MNGYEIQARRHAREVVGDLRWQGMTVPPLYARMAGEFEDLVRSGDYAAWVGANQKPAPTRGRSRVGGVFVFSQPSRNGNSRVARPRHLLPGPAALGR